MDATATGPDDPRVKAAVQLWTASPQLSVKQAMLQAGFTPADAENRGKQMWVRRRAPPKKVFKRGDPSAVTLCDGGASLHPSQSAREMQQRAAKRQKVQAAKPPPRPKLPAGKLLGATEWKAKFFDMVLFQSKNDGSTIIPPSDDADLQELAEWAKNERELFRQHVKGDAFLGKEQGDRVAALKQIGFVFEAADPRAISERNESKWLEKYNELVQYKRDHDNGDPHSQTKLGSWVSQQRQAYKEYKFHLERLTQKYPNHRPLLPEEMPRREKRTDPLEEGVHLPMTQGRIDKLNAMEGGFKWSVHAAVPFAQRLEEYKQYRSEHGHGFVKQSDELGGWVNKTRVEHKKFLRGERSQLTPEMVRQLEAARFEFAKNLTFQRRIEQYAQFRSEHGHGFVPQHCKDDHSLGQWVSSMRTAHLRYRRGDKSQLTREKIERLDAVNFEWSGGKRERPSGCEHSSRQF